MFAEFIYRPIAGQFPEKHFGDVSPYSSWVKFTDKIFQEWVGSFAKSWDGFLTSIINFEEQEATFVIAGGNGYMVDVSKRQLLSDKVIETITNAIKDDNRQRVIFTNGYDLQTIDTAGKVSVLLDKYFFDEMELLEIRDDILFARYWYYQKSGQPFSFQMNLLNFKIIDTFDNLAGKTT